MKEKWLLIISMEVKMKRERTTIRLDDNLKTRLNLLAIKNNISFNQMVIYILEIGYQEYIKRFDPYYENQNKKLKLEESKYE